VLCPFDLFLFTDEKSPRAGGLEGSSCTTCTGLLGLGPAGGLRQKL
jgi:hypothetical protein